MLTEHGPAMLVAAPVLDGAGNGPHRGSVLLARVITPDVAARLAEQAQVQLEVTALQPATTAAPAAAEQSAVVTTRGLSLEVTRQLADIGGVPAVMLRIEVPRSVSARGLDAISFALLSLLVAGIIVLFVLLAASAQHGAAAGEPHDAPRGRDCRGRRPDAAHERAPQG